MGQRHMNAFNCLCSGRTFSVFCLISFVPQVLFEVMVVLEALVISSLCMSIRASPISWATVGRVTSFKG